MEKISTSTGCLRRNLFLLQRTSKMLLLVVVLFIQNPLFGQMKTPRFTVSFKSVYLSELLLYIEKNSNYSFVYNVADIEALGKKDFNCANMELRPILDRCFMSTNLKYEIKDNHVVVSRRDGTIPPPVAQQAVNKVVITGNVVDVGREPLVAVTVRVRGNSKGVITDALGNYRLETTVPDKGDVFIMYSFIGMETKSVKYTGQPKVDVVLKESESMMDEVVVQTGYQTLDKRKITSAVTTLKMKDIEVPSLATVDLMLESHVPGMVFMKNSGSVGATPRLRIRGTSTILGNQEPLWVIDGVVQQDPVNVDPSQLNDLDFVNLLGNAISGLNPEDIEQIDVLKDASATAIYGARAGNGVIVITTKRGAPGPPSVSYSFSGTISARPNYDSKFVNMMNSKERIDYSREMMDNHQTYGQINSWVGYEGAMKEYYDGNINYNEMKRRVDYYEGLNTDWFDLLTRTSFTQKHTVSLSGGSSAVRYYASMGLQDASGNVKNETNKTYTANVNLTANYKRLSMRFGVNANVQDRSYNPTELDVLNYAYNTSRAVPAYDEFGEPYSYYKFYQRAGSSINMRLPFNIMNEMNNSYSDSRVYGTTITAGLDYKIMDPLKFGVVLSYSMSNADQQKYYGDKTYYASTLRAEGDVVTGSGTYDNLMPYGGELTQLKTDRHSYVIRGQFAFDKDLDSQNKHNISAAVGGELSSNDYKSHNQIYRGYMLDRGLAMGNFDPQKYAGYYDWYYDTPTARGVRSLELTNLVSGYATLSYDYDGRYMFNVNARADASNQFGSRSNEKILPIWSLSGRWNIKRDFMNNVKWLNSLSVRASWGLQGNMLSNQSSQLIVNRTGAVNGNNEYVSTVASYPNPDLRWEKTSSTNVTLDFGFLDNRISGSVSYFYKKTNDAFLSKRVSQINGVNSYVVNRGTLQNQGLELGLSFLVINRATKGNPEGLRWTLTPNVGQTLNELLNKASSTTIKDKYYYSDFLNGTIEIPGKALNSFYSYKFQGLNPEDGRPMFYGMDQEEFEAKYQNMSFDEICMEVMGYSGKRVPVFQGGLMNSFSYKRFSLGLNLAFSFGSKVRLLKMYPNVASGYGTIAPQPDKNVRRELLDRWRNPGDEKYTNIPGTLSGSEFTNTLSQLSNWWMKPYPFAANIWQMYDYSDIRVVSGNYLRLQALSLRYNLPGSVCKKITMKSAYVAFYATNLFTICSKELKGQDPTTQSGTSATINMSNRPTYSLSLNVTF